MANTFIKLIDSKKEINRQSSLEGLAGVGFLQHQFHWFIDTVRRKPHGLEGEEMIAGYCGIKSSTTDRRDRISMVYDVLKGLEQPIMDSLYKQCAAGRRINVAMVMQGYKEGEELMKNSRIQTLCGGKTTVMAISGISHTQKTL